MAQHQKINESFVGCGQDKSQCQRYETGTSSFVGVYLILICRGFYFLKHRKTQATLRGKHKPRRDTGNRPTEREGGSNPEPYVLVRFMLFLFHAFFVTTKPEGHQNHHPEGQAAGIQPYVILLGTMVSRPLCMFCFCCKHIEARCYLT